MKSHGVIHVTQVRNLEISDLFAMETAGRLASGKVRGVFYSPYDLTDEAREYMVNSKLTIPEDRYTPLGGTDQVFVLFEPRPFTGDSSAAQGQLDHIFLLLNDMIAVFEYERFDLTNVRECSE